MFLSDATIRRWCGPRWRIATSRQTRDMAVLAELQAANLDRLVKKTAQPGPIYTDFATADIGELALDGKGVHSSVQGSLEFMTPMAEIPLRKVTKAEADAYNWWRDGYQRNWRWAFDPIALRLTLRQDRLAGDLTVMPLIAGTEYREFLSISREGEVRGGRRRPARRPDPFHPGHQSEVADVRPGREFPLDDVEGSNARLAGFVGGGLRRRRPRLARGGQDSPREIGADLRRANLAAAAGGSLRGLQRVPPGRLLGDGRAPSSSRPTPGMVGWESLSYKDQPYVKITPTERAKGQQKELEHVAICYSASGDALLVTLNENVLKRAIDRQLAHAAEGKDKPATAGGRQSLGWARTWGCKWTARRWNLSAI